MGSHIGLVGCGRWGSLILRDLRELGCDVTVVAVGSDSVERATNGGAREVVRSVADLDSVDGVVVATPTVDHHRAISEALDLGIKVFTEKPMTNDAALAAELAAAAPDSLFVMDKWRYHPGILRLAEIATNGELGAPRGLVTRRNQWGQSHSDVDAVWILLPHDLSITLEILGEVPEPKSARSLADGEQLLAMTAMLGDEPWVTIEVSERAVEVDRTILLYCADGTAVLSHHDYTKVTIRREGESEQVEAVAPTMPLRAELEAFVRHLDGGPPPRSSAADGALIVKRIAQLRKMAAAQ